MKHLLDRAVVVGSGIGGLAAAGALAPYFHEVEVFDRDDLPTSPRSRVGTPQDRHSHGLLAGGLKALGEIFPGFQDDLISAGAVPVGVAQDFRFEHPDVGVLPQRDFGLSIVCASRPLIEHILRRRAEALPNVLVRRGCRVTEIMAGGGGVGPVVRFSADAGPPTTRDANFVVDASGRGALTLALLDALGWERPDVTEIGVDIAYATVVVSVPRDAPTGWKLGLTFGEPRFDPRHAVLVPIEGHRWTVTIAELHAGARLENWETFLEHGLARLHTRTFFTRRFVGRNRPTKSGNTVCLQISGAISSACRAFRTAYCRWATRCAGSIQSMVRACPPPRNRLGCCATCWNGCPRCWTQFRRCRCG